MVATVKNWFRKEDFGTSPHRPGARIRRQLWRSLNWLSRWQLDSALRYDPIAGDLRQRFGQDHARIIEVGSGDYGITPFLKIKLVGIDIAFNGRNLVLNGTLIPVISTANFLPLKSKAVDSAICVDVMEHLVPAIRFAVIEEIFRIVRPGGKIYFLFPCDDRSAAYDQKLQNLLKRQHGHGNTWLDEHINHGLPNRDDFIDTVKTAANRCQRQFFIHEKTNVNRNFWLLYQRILTVHESLLSLYCQRLLQPLLPLLRRVNGTNAYRRLFIIELMN